MKKPTLLIAVMATITLSGGLVQAQDAVQKINRAQLNEQIREAAQLAGNENARTRNTERHQERYAQNDQHGATDQKMEQNRYQHQERNQYEQQMNSQHDSERSSHYGQGYESRTTNTGTRSHSRSGRQGGRH